MQTLTYLPKTEAPVTQATKPNLTMETPKHSTKIYPVNSQLLTETDLVGTSVETTRLGCFYITAILS